MIADCWLHWLKKRKVRKLEKRHAEGYARFPVENREFEDWQDEQVWDV